MPAKEERRKRLTCSGLVKLVSGGGGVCWVLLCLLGGFWVFVLVKHGYSLFIFGCSVMWYCLSLMSLCKL